MYLDLQLSVAVPSLAQPLDGQDPQDYPTYVVKLRQTTLFSLLLTCKNLNALFLVVVFLC